jgi:uncharacterized protein (UPF0335 family)
MANPKSGQVGGIAGEQLRAIIDRVERLHEERKAIGEDIKDIYSEARGNGFDCKVIQHLIKLRAQDPSERDEFDTMVEVYARAIGMLPDLSSDEQEAA